MPVLSSALTAALSRTLFVVLVAGPLTGLPGAATPAHGAGTPPPYRVAQGAVLRPAPPPWVLPVTDYRITATFGAVSSLWASSHTGLDFAAAPGTPIRSSTPGEVVAAGYDGAYGYRVVVRMADGTEVSYAHQSEIVADVGSQVAPGDLLGYVGATGNVTGAHLHLEVRDAAGTPLDPSIVLGEHGVRI